MPARIRGVVLATVAATMLMAAGGADGSQRYIYLLPLVVSDGGHYEGARRDGRPHGHGFMVWPEGPRYEGEWRDGQPHGHGVYTNGPHHDPERFRYEGGFHYDLIHGQGVITAPLIGHIEGEFVYGLQYGQGVHTFPGGSRYEGWNRCDMWHGPGVFTSPGRALYEGAGLRRRYDGGPRDVYTPPVRTRYAGEWRWGEFYEGEGFVTYLYGERVLKDGVFTAADRYEGEWRHDRHHGRGVGTSPDGARYEGEWRWGQWHGRGVHTSPDGTRYAGEFVDGERHGYGVRTAPGGERDAGMFYKGRFLGRCSRDGRESGAGGPSPASNPR